MKVSEAVIKAINEVGPNLFSGEAEKIANIAEKIFIKNRGARKHKRFDFKSEDTPVETCFGQIYKEVK